MEAAQGGTAQSWVGLLAPLFLAFLERPFSRGCLGGLNVWAALQMSQTSNCDPASFYLCSLILVFVREPEAPT